MSSGLNMTAKEFFVIEHVYFDERFLMVVSDSSDPPFFCKHITLVGMLVSNVGPTKETELSLFIYSFLFLLLLFFFSVLNFLESI